MKFKVLIAVWWQGFKDGWQSPHELSTGMSYGDGPEDIRNEVYDRGVNWGQFIRSPFNHQKD